MCIYLKRNEGVMDDGDAEGQGMLAAATTCGSDVLIVDDEPVIRMLVSEVLEDTGHRLLEAGDGPSGLAILQSPAKIDLLIIDVGLPGGMNGRQLADAARAIRPELKVLFITGYAENAAVRSALVEPGRAALTKPFSVEQLSLKVVEIRGDVK